MEQLVSKAYRVKKVVQDKLVIQVLEAIQVIRG